MIIDSILIDSAYISGALTGLAPELEILQKRTYEEIGEECKLHGIDPYIPHQHSDPVKHAHYTSREVYDLDKKMVRASKLLIVEASQPSFGPGAEAEMAEEAGKPVILCFREGVRVSRLMRGVPAVRLEIIYGSLPELRGKLREWFEANKG